MVFLLNIKLMVNIQNKNYSKIPILRPPLRLSKSGLKDHFWTVSKVVSNLRYTVCRNEEKNNFNFTNKVFNGQDVLIAEFPCIKIAQAVCLSKPHIYCAM